MNPFETNTMPVDRMAQLLYRQEEIEQIKKHVDARRQTVVLGVEGVGKTSLLNCVFNRNYRIEKALDGTLISPVTEFPSDLKQDDLYIHFTEMIINSVGILAQCGKADIMDIILKRCRDIREEKNSPELYFEKIVKLIYNDYEYRIVMVVDNFERFTSSKDVTMKHHETLRKLLNCVQYIVASNYDLNKDSLPPGVSGSFLLMCFAGNEIRIGGWSKEHTAEYIKNCLAGNEISFSDEFTSFIYNITGGIPLLLNLTANYAYEHVKSTRCENGLAFEPLYNKTVVQTLMSHWCKLISSTQVAAINNFVEGNPLSTEDNANLRCLYLRGFMEFKSFYDENGNKIVSDSDYRFCCRLLEEFCVDAANLETALSRNPLIKVSESQHHSKTQNTSTKTILLLIEETVKLADVKQDKLEAMLREAYLKAEDDITEYKKLGLKISGDSRRLSMLNLQCEKIKELQIEVHTKFDVVNSQIRAAVSEDMIFRFKEFMDNMCTEAELRLQEFTKGVIW